MESNEISHFSELINIGSEILTIFGWGIVTGIRADSSLEIELDDWTLAGSSLVKVYGFAQNIILKDKVSNALICSACSIGKCVYTKYGSGILIDYDRDRKLHIVRLWQPYGQGLKSFFYYLTGVSIYLL
jgi:hypothetical protein